MKAFFQRHVLHNLGLKLLSLALALGLWRALALDQVTEIAVDVPIEFHNIPENLEISSEYIPRAQIRVRGPERVVRRLQAVDVSADIELSGMKPGERTFDLTADQIHQPRELAIVAQRVRTIAKVPDNLEETLLRRGARQYLPA